MKRVEDRLGAVGNNKGFGDFRHHDRNASEACETLAPISAQLIVTIGTAMQIFSRTAEAYHE